MDPWFIGCLAAMLIASGVFKAMVFLGGDGAKNEAGRRAVGWGLHKLFK